MGTPIHPNSKLKKGETKKDVDETRYKGMIGSLMYLTSFRPDIVQSVGMRSRFQSKSKESHLSAVKRIIRYVHGTSNFALWYPKIDDFSAVGYCNADFARDRVDRRSTSGIRCFLGKSLNVWSSKKQSTVALSTPKAEYIAASSCCSQLIWLKIQLADYKLNVENIPLSCDNMSAINISKNAVLHSRTKYIEVRFHSIREHVQKGNISIQFVKSEDQLADIFIKPLAEDRFCMLRTNLGIISHDSLFVHC
ncbi:secreted RxLR effector protein 161-like [Arachis stenosperma]|uniref:secreted RxLR effector protein 161-like n=1 Tax=Arachis stenosperma TaxID=217475 RepID=UPI0025AC66C4|nr:secreted RxLR effector protein 161-like [Arachis stenosperma]